MVRLKITKPAHPRMALVELVKRKNDILKKVDPDAPPYVDQEDIEELRRWPRDRAERTIKRMIVRLFSGDNVLSATCPWCNAYECSKCTYAKRHGRCTNKNVHFSRIATALERVENYAEIFDECFGALFDEFPGFLAGGLLFFIEKDPMRRLNTRIFRYDGRLVVVTRSADFAEKWKRESDWVRRLVTHFSGPLDDNSPRKWTITDYAVRYTAPFVHDDNGGVSVILSQRS